MECCVRQSTRTPHALVGHRLFIDHIVTVTSHPPDAGAAGTIVTGYDHMG